jgi:methionyl aminopeptidase
MAIKLKSKDEIEKMRVAGRTVHSVLQAVKERCKPGITTKELDDLAGKLIEESGGIGLFKGYEIPGQVPFPSNLCISINDTVVHGIGDETRVEEGDIVSIDCGIKIDGWCGDSAISVLVGETSPEVRRLSEVTRYVLELAVENMKPGRRWSQVARMMQNYAERAGLGVVRDFVGHGIGQSMHEEPKVPNFFSNELKRHDIDLRPGMVLAVEPMCNLGRHEVKTLSDGWTVKTADGKASAHWEHTVAVTDNGADVLTDGK